jgi:hypothetical protein
MWRTANSKMWIGLKYFQILRNNVKNSLGRHIEGFFNILHKLICKFCYLSPSQWKLRKNIYTAFIVGSINTPFQQILPPFPGLPQQQPLSCIFPRIQCIGKSQFTVPLLPREISSVCNHTIINHNTCKTYVFVLLWNGINFIHLS